MQRKSLLFLTGVYPFPFDFGQRVRIYNLLAACARVFDVTFVGPPPDRAEDRHVVDQMCARAVYLEPARDDAPLETWVSALRAAPGIPRRRTVRMYLPFAAALAKLDV